MIAAKACGKMEDGPSFMDPRKMRLILHGVFGESDVEASLVLRPCAKLAAFQVAGVLEVEVQQKCRGGRGPGNGWHKAARRLPQYRIVSDHCRGGIMSSARLLCPSRYIYGVHKDAIATALLLIWFHRTDTIVLCAQDDDVRALQTIVDER